MFPRRKIRGASHCGAWSSVEMNAKYVHTNLVAYDYQRLAQFYEGLFGCVPVLPNATSPATGWID